MADGTSIEWTDATWNPVRGCSRITPGCGGPNHEGGCYAEKIAARFSEPGMAFHGFAVRTPHGGRWTGKMALVDELLDQPLRWRKPRRIFVNSMSDPFHENLPDAAIDKVFAVMALASWHTMQLLTKRADRQRAYLSAPDVAKRVWGAANDIADDNERLYLSALAAAGGDWGGDTPWPLPNVWIGASVEDRERKHRIEDLRATPAAVRFISFEPLLEDVGRLDLTGIHLAILGGESGPRSRWCETEAVQNILLQCQQQGVACFVKQLGARPTVGGQPLKLKSKKGGDMAEWPEDLRVREFPR